MRDADLWPERLTREMFLEYFHCEVSTMTCDAQVRNQTRVFDLESKELT